MGNIFSAAEVLQFAIKIEENGEKFYSGVANKIKDQKLADVFMVLAKEEVSHKEVYSKMLSEIESYEPQGSYPDEYFLYLKSYVENIIFNSQLGKELEKSSDLVSIINFAIQREEDSILYYIEMKNFVSPHQTKVIDKIIDEERKHFIKLTNFKKEYL